MSSKIESLVQQHPGATAATVAILIVVVIILIVVAVHYHGKVKAAETKPFDTSAWKYGSVMDQGYFRPSLTPAQLSVYMPQLGGVRSELSRMMMTPVSRGMPSVGRSMMPQPLRPKGQKMGRRGRVEGLDPVPQCPPGTQPVPDGSSGGGYTCVPITPPTPPPKPPTPPTPPAPPKPPCESCDVCPSTGNFNPITGTMIVDTSTIGKVWDPSAIAEADALAELGSYYEDPSGDEMSLQAAIASARDSDSAAYSMTDAQLSTIMALGTAP